MKTRTHAIHVYQKPVFLLLFSAFLSQLSSCGGSSGNSSGEDAIAAAIAIAFWYDVPIFFAVKDGDNAWVEMTPSLGDNMINIADTAGRYAFVAYGKSNGVNAGYYLESTVADSTSHSFHFDNSSTLVSDTIEIEAGNFDSGSYLWLGRNARNFANRLDLGVTGSFMAPVLFEYESSGPLSGDALFILQKNGAGHASLQNKIYADGVPLSYTAMPVDVNIPFGVDHSAIRNDAGYIGLGLSFSGVNLKAKLQVDMGLGSDTVMFEKFPAGIGRTFSLRAKWEYPGTSPLTERLKYSEYYNDPPLFITLDKSPARGPAVTVSSDNNYAVRLDYSSVYDGGIPGVKNVARRADFFDSSLSTFWRIKQTMGRYQVGNQTLGLDASVLSLPNFPTGMEPMAEYLTKFGIFSTNYSVQQELDFLGSGRAASAEDDGRIRVTVTYIY